MLRVELNYLWQASKDTNCFIHLSSLSIDGEECAPLEEKTFLDTCIRLRRNAFLT